MDRTYNLFTVRLTETGLSFETLKLTDKLLEASKDSQLDRLKKALYYVGSEDPSVAYMILTTQSDISYLNVDPNQILYSWNPSSLSS